MVVGIEAPIDTIELIGRGLGARVIPRESYDRHHVLVRRRAAIAHAAETHRLGPFERRRRIHLAKHVAGLVPGAAQNESPLAGLVPAPLLDVPRHVVAAERTDAFILSRA